MEINEELLPPRENARGRVIWSLPDPDVQPRLGLKDKERVLSAYVSRVDIPPTGRGDAATWIVRGDESRWRRGRDVDSGRRVAAAPRPG